MKKAEAFDRLVENALDFLNKSNSELENTPKHAIISFYTAVELILKARLMAEHWTLVVSRKQEPDWENFKKGNFQSVTLEQAAARLKKVIGSGLTKEEYSVFDEIRKHRNKMVHFFHEISTQQEGEKFRTGAAKQHLKAWYFLIQLIRSKWDNVFADWLHEFDKFDQSLKRIHEYLGVVFARKSEEISLLKAEGFLIYECPSCKFNAQKHSSAERSLYESVCLVCGLTESCIRIVCEDCGTEIVFRNEGFAECNKCKKSYEPVDLADLLEDRSNHYEAIKDGDTPLTPANCSECDGYHTVIENPFGAYLCASCFNGFEDLSFCGWCNEANTGDMEFSYYRGCNHCDGNTSWDKD